MSRKPTRRMVIGAVSLRLGQISDIAPYNPANTQRLSILRTVVRAEMEELANALRALEDEGPAYAWEAYGEDIDRRCKGHTTYLADLYASEERDMRSAR